MNRIIKYKLYAGLLFVGISGYSQEQAILVNVGDLYISPKTLVTTLMDFDNTETAVLYNDGDLYLQASLENNGLFTFNEANKTGYTIFESPQLKSQRISGKQQLQFLDVLFNKTTADTGIDLKNDISIAGTANFTKGIVHIDSLQGALIFEKSGKVINANNGSHVNGEVEKKGKESFEYPIGNGQFYRKAIISAPKEVADNFSGKYYTKNATYGRPEASKAGVILDINEKEYWTIQQLQTNNDIILTLSWDANTTPNTFFSTPEKNLHIVRWDEQAKMWVDQGGIVDVDNRTVTTPTVVDGYGIFTLATVKHNLILEGDVVIYNAVSTNGDGTNDYFFIDNIQKYPNNTVQIYNRWGVKVFETKAYDTTGNVFAGYSDGKGTINKNEKLPTGTYYYILTYEHTDANGSNMIKKAGYLHLENN